MLTILSTIQIVYTCFPYVYHYSYSLYSNRPFTRKYTLHKYEMDWNLYKNNTSNGINRINVLQHLKTNFFHEQLRGNPMNLSKLRNLREYELTLIGLFIASLGSSFFLHIVGQTSFSRTLFSVSSLCLTILGLNLVIINIRK